MFADECFRKRNDVIIMCRHRRFMAAQKPQLNQAAENEDRLLFLSGNATAADSL